MLPFAIVCERFNKKTVLFLRGIPFVDLVVLSNQKLKKVVSVYWFMLLLLRAFFSTKFSQKFRVRPIRGCGLYAGKYGSIYSS